MAKNDAVIDTQAATPAFHLIVVHPFLSYEKGAHISDAAKIAEVMAGENAAHCNKVAPLQ